MAESNENPTNTPTPPAPPAPPAPTASDPPRFSQADLDRVAGTTRAEARKQAERQLAEDLGVSLDEAKAIVAARREADRSSLSEAERAKQDAERLKAEAEADRVKARRVLHEANIETALRRAGAPVDQLARVARMVDADEGADEGAIASAVDSLKSEFPALFGVADNAPTAPIAGAPPAPAPPSSTPTGSPPKPRGPEDAFAAAMEAGRQAARPRYAPAVGASNTG